MNDYYRLTPDWVYPNQRNYTKEERPYGYSAHFIKGGHKEAGESCDAVYSDRLRQQYENHSEIARRYFKGDYLDRVSLGDLSKYLSDLFRKKVRVTAVAEECHLGNGYPLWILYYQKED